MFQKDIEFDPWCDPYNPKTILPRDIYKAASMIGQKIQATPLVVRIDILVENISF